jgi:hypothetical protein
MRFLCLVYGDQNALQTMKVDECIAYDNELRASGKCVASESLEPTSTAATVRVRNGRPVVTDGPFVEAKEALAGFYLLEAASLEEAVRLAAKIPPAQVGGIEVRPIRPIRDAEWQRAHEEKIQS